MQRNQARLGVEELESRTLPSATPLVPPALNAARTAPMPVDPVNLLAGQGAGTFSTTTVQSGAGTDYSLYGQGLFAALGHVGIRGDIHAGGPLAHGQTEGTVRLTNDHGSVTLELTGPGQSGLAPLHKEFSFRITGGTGAYAHLSDQGKLTLDLIGAPAGHQGSFVLSVAQPAKPGAALDGTLAGHITPEAFLVVDPLPGHPVPVDGGATYNLNGGGTLAGLGQVTMTGVLQSTGLVTKGHASGELTISGAAGSVTLDLRGPVQGAFAPLPGQFDFTVHSGTGAYAHLSAAGTVTVRLDLTANTFTLAILAA